MGTATLFIESKFTDNSGLVGHIEDVVVEADFQGRRVGKKIIECVINVAKETGQLQDGLGLHR